MANRLVVLESFQKPGPATNPYIVMLARSVAAVPDVDLLTFTWPRAMFGRVDVFHVHWPEVVIRGSDVLRTTVRRVLFVGVLARLAVTRTPVVRTMHNLAPHEGASRVEDVLLSALERLTTARIYLNTVTTPPPDVISSVIVHGHYRDWYAEYPKASPVPGRIASFGLIKPYKGVDRLITAFREAARSEVTASLQVAGRPITQAFAEELRELAGDDERIDLEFSYVDDATLVRLVTEAELVALPYRQMYNSGGVLSALSLERPVLVPDSETNRALAREVGEGWVHLFRGELTARHLLDTLTEVRERPPATAPDLSGREWHLAGQAHVEVFRRALAARRRGKRRPIRP